VIQKAFLQRFTFYELLSAKKMVGLLLVFSLTEIFFTIKQQELA